MRFAYPLPWWLTLLVAVAVLAVAYLSYRRPVAPLPGGRRAVLMSLRALTFAAVIVFLCRPVTLVPAPVADVPVPVLVDISRSMRVADVDGRTRIAQAIDVLEELLPALPARFRPELYGVGDGLAPIALEQIGADARHSSLQDAVAAVRARYRGRAIPAVVLISDGADTESTSPGDTDDEIVAPVHVVAMGSTDARDREVMSIVAGDPRMEQALVDLRVTAVSHGFGREPFELRLLSNGTLVERRDVTPPTDGSPVTEHFTVSPDPITPTVYAASISVNGDEVVAENNTASVLISPAGRPRRVLLISGSPGYDHAFLARALAGDTGLEIDTVVRKGRDETGRDTFLVQAPAARAAALADGFPGSRDALFAYDAVVILNVEGDVFTRAQLDLVAAFIAERGGGLVVTGGRSFAARGLIGTALEVALPLELDDRRGGLARAVDVEPAGAPYSVTLTPEGERHAVMRLGESPADTAARWLTVPPLAGAASLGGPRPGAAVLAVTRLPNGATSPLVATQRYGRGRTLTFAGEAAWRWRMQLPAADRTFETFWRQAVRWAASGAPDAIEVTVADRPEPGDTVLVAVDVRSPGFVPVEGVSLDGTLTAPTGASVPVSFTPAPGLPGRFSAVVSPDRAGLYRLTVDARRGGTELGSGDRWVLVGGTDRELSDPRLNEGLLRRLAQRSGGEYLTPDEASRIAAILDSVTLESGNPVLQDLWHQPWAFVLVAGLLSAEWLLRRRWGLR